MANPILIMFFCFFAFVVGAQNSVPSKLNWEINGLPTNWTSTFMTVKIQGGKTLLKWRGDVLLDRAKRRVWLR